MVLTPLDEALDRLLEDVPAPPETEELSLESCLGRVLAQPLLAANDVPPTDNSAMDGYAVRSGDLPGALTVSQRIPAGAPAQPLVPGTAARIFTGAILPEGADAIVIQEDVTVAEDHVVFSQRPSPGAHVRRRGADIASGSVVLDRGAVLGSQELGLAAAAGSSTLSVYRPLRVAILTTGDELRSPGVPLEDWQIYDSNGVQLVAQLQSLGCEVVLRECLPDDPRQIGDALEKAASLADCLITCGGVSVGEEDHVRAQIEARGELRLWKLAIKPGKPLAFGRVAHCPVFGLPGNPVSAWVTFGLVVKPWLQRARGARVAPLRRCAAVAGFAVPRPGTREEYLRVTLSGDVPPVAQLAGSQSSGVLSSVARADALAVVPVGATVEEGDSIEVILLSELESPRTE